ncbi:glycoside hydrolase family 15 protein [Salegentibacter salegens]|uniref:Glucoamylase (Glucan-1,4-alpha-glucosidase), GH15 family n=1 Tax=Salegentibacter salegens TaxID=143223 RepID=A0A1M7JST0_9FLAO|nr:glycoside hydrolase family 15 protein [Salegentibacter salegens]PRX51923.1 GH15 family glucan-1,4-alpha-glucosidase [Salegentibacter salegens]SHM56048.1 Glucoamylase (glucan-1,4-alpha-glucosidase), GH15 family [Salegentibacter salegens]
MENLDYGIIGNCKSAALISKTGSLEWCCLPNFASAAVFAKLLDEKKGGSFEIIVDDSYKITQEYLWETNILNTEFTDGENSFQVIDFMPRYPREDGSFYAPPDIIRFIRLISGKPKFKVKYDPRLDFAREKTYNEFKGNYIKSFTKEGKYDSLFLYSSFDLNDVLEERELELTGNAYFLLGYHEKLITQSLDRSYLKFQRTKTYWMNWSAKTTRYTHYENEIMRSALVLKCLSYKKSGAVLAAATTSLPETIGEERNWDYRFCWIRDASMVIKVMAGLGHIKSAKDFLQFIIDIIPDKDEKIQIMYGINGEKELTEHILDHLSGYKDSHPVRTGNAAYIQKQNDIYGILMEVIYQQFNQFETSLENSEELWTVVRGIVSIVEENWQKPDKGIWELRTEDRHFVFSKLLCWVAIDRAIKIGEVLRMGINDTHWKSLRAEIYNDIYNNGWNEEVQAYTQYYGSKDLDASTLLMEQYGFIEAKDPRFVSTVHATERELCKDGLMYRYKNKDDFGEPTSSFTICTFWLIDSLFKVGEKKKAKQMFDQLLSYSNHLGLFSEDIDFETKRLLGNFPQAYSHLALIETAANFSLGTTSEETWLSEF